MKWGAFIVVTLAALMMIFYEKPQMGRYAVKDRLAFAVLLAFGWVVTLLLVIYPELPGPTQWVDAVYKPLGKLLEK